MKLEVKKVKIFVTVPTENSAEVKAAMCNAGAGVIGNYTCCTTTVKSVGTFLPNQKSHPHIGERGKLETVEEDKIEVICDVEQVGEVVKRLREVHPYEEPAIDIVPLLDESCFGSGI